MPSLNPDSDSVSGGNGIISELPTRRIFLVISTAAIIQRNPPVAIVRSDTRIE